MSNITYKRISTDESLIYEDGKVVGDVLRRQDFWCFAQSISALDSTWGKEHRRTLLHLAGIVQVLGFPRTDAEAWKNSPGPSARQHSWAGPRANRGPWPRTASSPPTRNGRPASPARWCASGW